MIVRWPWGWTKCRLRWVEGIFAQQARPHANPTADKLDSHGGSHWDNTTQLSEEGQKELPLTTEKLHEQPTQHASLPALESHRCRNPLNMETFWCADNHEPSEECDENNRWDISVERNWAFNVRVYLLATVEGWRQKHNQPLRARRSAKIKFHHASKDSAASFFILAGWNRRWERLSQPKVLTIEGRKIPAVQRSWER